MEEFAALGAQHGVSLLVGAGEGLLQAGQEGDVEGAWP